jgi:membrane fusion protein (multidrug efflux system)
MNTKNLKTIIKAGSLITAIAGGTYWYFQHMELYPSTEDAYVNANLVNVAPKVNGYVTNVLVKNDQLVHKGDVLFRIETKDYTVQLFQQQQALQYAKEQAASAKTQISSAQAGVVSARANYVHMQEQVARYSQMNNQEAASTEDLQKYQTQLAQAKAQLTQAENLVIQDDALLSAANAQIEQAQSGVQNAQNHVGYTDVTSAVNGYVTNMYLTPGQYVSAGQQVFGLVDNDSWWIDANFKETDLERIKAGEPVAIKLDMYKHGKYTGIVQSVSYASGGTFSLLPAQNATGNWVKVTQRFTTRIKVKNNAEYPLRVGASADVEVDTTHKKIS